jgi:hypothetical protein
MLLQSGDMMIEIEVSLESGKKYVFDVHVPSFDLLIKLINKKGSNDLIRLGNYAFKKESITQIIQLSR